jgi:hypothetical protein
MKKTTVRAYQAVCDATNNTPMTIGKEVRVRLMVQFYEDPSDTFFIVDIPVPLKGLRKGLKTVRVEYPTF